MDDEERHRRWFEENAEAIELERRLIESGACDRFLHHPGAEIIPLDRALFEHVGDLVGDVSVDLNAPLPPDDNEEVEMKDEQRAKDETDMISGANGLPG